MYLSDPVYQLDPVFLSAQACQSVQAYQLDPAYLSVTVYQLDPVFPSVTACQSDQACQSVTVFP